jgi:hypothetical protein
MVLFTVLANISASTEAKSPDITPDGWTNGTDVVIDTLAHPVPSGYQMFGKGVKITSPGKICHEFRRGLFKWVADIHRLVNGKWVRVPATTLGWEPDEEGDYMACAQADQVGTYALMAYYTGPSVRASAPTPPLSPVCQTAPFTMTHYTVSPFDPDFPDSFDYRLGFSDITTPLPHIFTISILSYTPTGSSLEIYPSDATKDFSGLGPSFLMWLAQADDQNIEPIVVRIETGTCHFDFTLTEMAD